MVLPTLTPGATLLALRHVLSNLQSTIRARAPPDLSRALIIILGVPTNAITCPMSATEPNWSPTAIVLALIEPLLDSHMHCTDCVLVTREQTSWYHNNTLFRCPGRSQRLARDNRTDTLAAQQAALDFLRALKCPLR